jgi:pilus assembly protein Flp/PilA
MQDLMEERSMKVIKQFLQDDSAAAAVEYGLMVALIAVVIISAVTALGKNLSAKFNAVATSIANAGS